MSRLPCRVIFIQIRSVVLGIHHLESCLYYELFYYTRSYAPFITIIPISLPFVMHLLIHMFHTSVIPYIPLDDYLNSNLYTTCIPNMRFFCCSVYYDTLTWVNSAKPRTSGILHQQVNTHTHARARARAREREREKKKQRERETHFYVFE